MRIMDAWSVVSGPAPPAHRETPHSLGTANCFFRFVDNEIEHYLAEWYLPELTEQSVDDIVERLGIAASIVSGEGTPVRFARHPRSSH